MRARGFEEPQGGLPRNYLRASLLLLIAESPAHGYDLLEQIKELGLANVDPGGLYRGLRVMEQDGLVASHWEHSTAGPARRSYRLTEEGVEWLHAWAGALREGRRYLSAYLSRYDSIDAPVAVEAPTMTPADVTSEGMNSEGMNSKGMNSKGMNSKGMNSKGMEAVT